MTSGWAKTAKLSIAAKFREWVPDDPADRDGMTFIAEFVSLSFRFSLSSLSLEGCSRGWVWAPVELEKVQMVFEPSQKLRPASLSDRKVPRDDAFLR